MNKLPGIILLITVVAGCHKEKDKHDDSDRCDMRKVYADNAARVTVTNGVWGTIAFMEGNCMPTVPAGNSCSTCPVKRTVRIYEYTTQQQAHPPTATKFFDSFDTQLIKEVGTDDNGFFQTELPAGKYTIAIVEEGKLYANGGDDKGGITPFEHKGGATNVNETLIYKATF
jgi:hypothetical protein